MRKYCRIVYNFLIANLLFSTTSQASDDIWMEITGVANIINPEDLKENSVRNLKTIGSILKADRSSIDEDDDLAEVAVSLSTPFERYTCGVLTICKKVEGKHEFYHHSAKVKRLFEDLLEAIGDGNEKNLPLDSRFRKDMENLWEKKIGKDQKVRLEYRTIRGGFEKQDFINQNDIANLFGLLHKAYIVIKKHVDVSTDNHYRYEDYVQHFYFDSNCVFSSDIVLRPTNEGYEVRTPVEIMKEENTRLYDSLIADDKAKHVFAKFPTDYAGILVAGEEGRFYKVPPETKILTLGYPETKILPPKAEEDKELLEAGLPKGAVENDAGIILTPSDTVRSLLETSGELPSKNTDTVGFDNAGNLRLFKKTDRERRGSEMIENKYFLHDLLLHQVTPTISCGELLEVGVTAKEVSDFALWINSLPSQKANGATYYSNPEVMKTMGQIVDRIIPASNARKKLLDLITNTICNSPSQVQGFCNIDAISLAMDVLSRARESIKDQESLIMGLIGTIDYNPRNNSLQLRNCTVPWSQIVASRK